jgi:hypothetical protein
VSSGLIVGSLAAVAVAMVFLGCQVPAHGRGQAKGSVPVLDAAVASAAGLSSQEVSDAGRLCAAKCVRCHKFYNPAVYSDSEWQRWMRKMSKKAKLDPNQAQLLSRYLGAFQLEHEQGSEK